MSQPAPAPQGLVRGIGRWDLVALSLNATIGAGILGLPSATFRLAGVYSLAAILLCAGAVFLIVLCFAEVGSRFERTGGPYRYARAAFGPFMGFQVGWLMWLARLTGFATICNLLISYASYFIPGLHAGVLRALAITVVVGALTIVNIVGVRQGAALSTVFTVGKLVPLLLFVALGLPAVDLKRVALATPVPYSAVSESVLLLVFAFSGFELLGIPAGETQDPRRDLPFAMLVGIGGATLLYLLIQLVSIGTLPALATSETPLADASARFLGTGAGSFIAGAAVVATFGTLSASMLAAPRLLFGMAEEGQLPGPFARIHPRFQTPDMAIVLTAAVMLVLTVSGTFIYALTVSTLIRLLTYGVTCAALPRLRRLERTAAPFHVAYGPAVATAAVIVCIWLVANGSWHEVRDTGIATALGLVLWAGLGATRQTTSASNGGAEGRGGPGP